MLFRKQQQLHDGLLGEGRPGRGCYEGGEAAKTGKQSKPDLTKSIASIDTHQKVDLIPKDFEEVFNRSMENFESYNDDIMVSEPRRFKGKCVAILQNLAEVIAVLVTLTVARTNSSFTSFGVSILIYLSIIPAFFDNQRRVLLGMVMAVINMAVIAIVILLKVYKAPRESFDFPSKGQNAAQEAHQAQWMKYRDYGYEFTHSGEQDAVHTLDMVSSLKFELSAMVIQLMSLIFFVSIHIRHKTMANPKNKVLALFLHHWTISRTMSDEDQDSSMALSTNTHQEQVKINGEKQDKLLTQNLQELYILEFDKIMSKFPRCYIDCFYFSKLNKIFFLISFLSCMVQSMAFNCLFVLPQVFMMLGIFTLYSQRNKMVLGYSYYIMIFMIWISISLFILLSYGTYVHTQSIYHWYIHNFESKEVQILSATFGQRVNSVEVKGVTFSRSDQIIHRVTYIISFIFAHGWLVAKFSSVRESTNFMIEGTSSFWQRWRFAHEFKNVITTRKQNIENIVGFLRKSRSSKKSGGKASADGSANKDTDPIASLNLKNLSKLGKTSLISDFKKQFNYIVPSLNIWLLRFGFGYQSYLYHSNMGLFHLSYVLATFFFSRKFSYFMSIYMILPIYILEFIILYGLGINGSNKIPFFQEAKEIVPVTRDQMKKNGSVLWEQTLYFFNLSMLFLAISSYRLLYYLQQKQAFDQGKEVKDSQLTEDGGDSLTIFIEYKLKQKLTDKDSPGFMSFYIQSLWKVSFYIFKYIHVIMLFTLLVQAAPDLNQFRALGFILLFAFWTVSEKLYRKTVKILIFFMSFFIMSQYFFSLRYHEFIDKPKERDVLEFFNMFQWDKLNKWKEDDPIYFRFKPYPYDWIILICTTALVSINKIFIKEKEAEQLENEIFVELMKRHQNLIYWFMLVKIKVTGVLVYLLMGLMFFFLGKVQTNLINIMFFSLIICLIMVASKNDNKDSTLRWSLFFSQTILTYSMFVIVTEFIFQITVGFREQQNKGMFDKSLEENYPWIYKNAQIIGFRMIENISLMPYADSRYRYQFRLKFTAYVVFMLVSKFCLIHFQDQKNKKKRQMDMDEEQWTLLLEYKLPTDDVKGKLKDSIKNFTKNSFKKMRTQSMTMKYNKSGDENSKNQDKEYKEASELQRFWINLQDDPSYWAYTHLHWWPFLDTLSTYSHLLTNLVIIYICLYIKVTIYSAFLLGSICLFYSLICFRISKSSLQIYWQSGLLEQTELKIAGLISKKYAQKTSREYLQLRSKFWKILSIIYVILVNIGFSTTLSYRYRDSLNFQYKVLGSKQKAERDLKFEQVQFSDKLQFWLFYLGIYKDHRVREQNFFYVPFLAIGFMLILERQAINWLLNRHGCTFNVFQKITEIENRVNLIENEVSCPPYDPQRYKNHYFYPDFELLWERMTESPKRAKMQTKKAKKDMTENREFLPYKIAVRIQSAIKFTLLIDSRSKVLNNGMEIDEQTKKMLDDYDNHCNKHGHFVPMHDYSHDYETYPILKNHKIHMIELMLKAFIERKYKISFMKGMMMLMEQLILFITLITMILKANMYSLIYFIFIIKYFYCESKVFLLVRMNYYIAVIFMLQYLCFLLNLTSATSPQPFPKHLESYPHLYNNKNIKEFPYNIPFFFQFKSFRDLNMSFFMGIGVQNHQIGVLMLDFINLGLISMYIFNFRNPLLFRSMRKVFWQYPNEFDPVEKWKRLDPNVVKQNRWFQSPYDTNHHRFNKSEHNNNDLNVVKLTKEEIDLSKENIKFVQDYKNIHRHNEEENDKDQSKGQNESIDQSKLSESDHHLNVSFHRYGTNNNSSIIHNQENIYDQADLNYMLINWLELKFDRVWSNDLLREKKWELKEECFYFRAVKQGSVLVYLSFHIFLCFIIMVMATIRRSLISFGYIVILLPRMKDGSEVLTQRDQNQAKLRHDAESKVKALRKEISELTKKQAGKGEQPIQDNESAKVDINAPTEQDDGQTGSKNNQIQLAKIAQLKSQLADAEIELKKLEKKRGPKTKLQLLEESQKEVGEQWAMIQVVKSYLLGYAIFDLFMQLYVQMPQFYNNKWERLIGIRKVWLHPLSNEKNAEHFGFDYAINKGNENLFQGLTLNHQNFKMQVAICFMICLISLQSEIFDSEGYKKYVTQTDGSLDLIIQLAAFKQKSLTYVYNNLKIQKILRNQQKREIIINTVERVKEKLVRWRQHQRTTLDPTKKKESPYVDKLVKNVATQARDDSGKPTVVNVGSSELANSEASPQASVSIYRSSETQNDLGVEKQKSVAFEQNVEVHPAVGRDDEDNDDQSFIELKRKTIPPEIVDTLINKLALEFVKSKKSKLGRCARCYLCLQRNFVIQVLFKNQKDDLKDIVEKQSKGQMMEVPCELEKVMINETKDIIRNKYDHKDGVTEQWKLWHATKGKQGEALLQVSQLDEKIKLKQMTNTWRFTRFSSLLQKYIETLFYILISNTDNIIYLSMMGSMFQSAGLVSLIYPISIFGYALLEETRPRQPYWNFIRNYTIMMLSIKFFINLKMLDFITNSNLFQDLNGIFMLGIRKQGESITQILFYLLPEIMIISFIMLNQVKLKLMGLYDKQEEDFENIKEAIQRQRFQGDVEKVQEEKIKRTYMDMSMQFRSYEDQKADQHDMKKAEQEKEKIQKEQMLAELEGPEENYEPKLSLEEQQEQLITGISRQIHLCANEYDIDNTGDVISDMDRLVKRKVIKKGLENDNLYFIEGATLHNHPDFINEVNFERELVKVRLGERALSSAEYKEEMKEIQEMLAHQNDDNTMSIFESNDYLKRIYPPSMEQKPGVDYYGTTTMLLFVIIIYITNYFDKLFVSPEDLLQGAKGSNNIFSGKLSLILLFIMIVIVIERYISRADVKEKVKDQNLELEEKSFFNKQQQFARSQTQRSMTVKLKTMKTSDLDMTGAESQEFLSAISEQKDTRGPSTNITKVSTQQRLKFYLHWLILICSHILIFYYIPIVGNIELYGYKDGPRCNDDEKQKYKYGCKNFHSMWYSMVFYALICLYLYLSAKQMRYGLPTFKIASSVMNGYEWYDTIKAQVYMMIPFAAELRCLCDYTFTKKTSLDIFQYWQLFNYHIELYIAKMGNQSYADKIYGAPVLFLDLIIGYLILGILLLILIGPIIFFSEYAFIQSNPVQEASISIALVITKNLTKQDLVKRSVWNWEENQNQKKNAKPTQTFDSRYRVTDEDFADALNNDSLHLFDMAYKNAYVRHPDDEIDYDIIFGRKDHKSRPVNAKRATKKRQGWGSYFKSFLRESEVELINEKIDPDSAGLITEVPFMLYKVEDPNMRGINDDYLKMMNYSKWTETKFFKSEQIQEVICTEYPDQGWMIDYFNKKFLMEDIKSSFVNQIKGKEGFELKLLIETKFMRNNPTEAKQATGKQTKKLNLTRLDDCSTMLQLENFASVDCDVNPQGTAQMLFQQAYTPYLILGATKNVYPMFRKTSTDKNINETNPQIIEDNQKYDILMEFRCPDIWLVRASKKRTIIKEHQLNQMIVDPNKQCEKQQFDHQEDANDPLPDPTEKLNDKKRYTRFNFTIFSMFVSGSFLAGFSVKTFYLAIAYGLSGSVRVAFIFGTWRGFVYEITDPMAIIKVMEACYMYRFEQDLYKEEECYRMVQEIIRQPDLMKALTGSSLRGQLDPMLDKFSEDDKKKYKQLEKLEATEKFDVTKMKEEIVNKYKD